jgi:hypothetical protein
MGTIRLTAQGRRLRRGGIYHAWQGSYQSDVAAQEAKLKHDADELSVYPVASLGLAWSF